MNEADKAYWAQKAREDRARFDREMIAFEGSSRAQGITPPRKPMSAFLEFAKTRRGELKAIHSGASNSELSKLLAIEWHNTLGEDKKQMYLDRYAKKVAAYNQEMKPYRLKGNEQVGGESPAAARSSALPNLPGLASPRDLNNQGNLSNVAYPAILGSASTNAAGISESNPAYVPIQPNSTGIYELLANASGGTTNESSILANQVAGIHGIGAVSDAGTLQTPFDTLLRDLLVRSTSVPALPAVSMENIMALQSLLRPSVSSPLPIPTHFAPTLPDNPLASFILDPLTALLTPAPPTLDLTQLAQLALRFQQNQLLQEQQQALVQQLASLSSETLYALVALLDSSRPHSDAMIAPMVPPSSMEVQARNDPEPAVGVVPQAVLSGEAGRQSPPFLDEPPNGHRSPIFSLDHNFSDDSSLSSRDSDGDEPEVGMRTRSMTKRRR